MKSSSLMRYVVLFYPLYSFAQQKVELRGTTYNMDFQDLITANITSEVLGTDTSLYTPNFSMQVPTKTNFDLHFTAQGMGITTIKDIYLKRSVNIGSIPLFPHTTIGGEYWIGKKKILFGLFKKNTHGFIPQDLFDPVPDGIHVILCDPKDTLSNTFLLYKEGNKAYLEFESLCIE